MGWLLDVNSLIALLDPKHIHNEAMHTWFARRQPPAWATCPLTENGVVRILAQRSYIGGPFAPAQTIGMLRAWKASYAGIHEMWHDDVFLTDATLFRAEYIVRPGQVSDAYLLGLAYRHAGRLVSFDRNLPWEAI